MWYTYIVRCSDDTLYTGITNNLSKRLRMHNNGKGGSYTRSRKPVKLCYSEPYRTRSESLKRESEIKKLNKTSKEKLVKKKFLD